MKYVVVGLVDDDNKKIGATIHGIPILSSIDKLADLRIPFDEVIICIPSATIEQIRRIIAICKSLEKPYRTVPTHSQN